MGLVSKWASAEDDIVKDSFLDLKKKKITKSSLDDTPSTSQGSSNFSSPQKKNTLVSKWDTTASSEPTSVGSSPKKQHSPKQRQVYKRDVREKKLEVTQNNSNGRATKSSNPLAARLGIATTQAETSSEEEEEDSESEEEDDEEEESEEEEEEEEESEEEESEEESESDEEVSKDLEDLSLGAQDLASRLGLMSKPTPPTQSRKPRERETSNKPYQPPHKTRSTPPRNDHKLPSKPQSQPKVQPKIQEKKPLIDFDKMLEAFANEKGLDWADEMDGDGWDISKFETSRNN